MVFLPFMLMTLIIGLLLYFFGLSPSTGRLNIAPPVSSTSDPVVDYRKLSSAAGSFASGLESDASNFAGGLESDASNLASGIDSRVKNLGDSIEGDLGMKNSDYYNQRDQGSTNDFARGDDNDRDTSDATSGNSGSSSNRKKHHHHPHKRHGNKKSSSSKRSSKDSEGFYWNY